MKNHLLFQMVLRYELLNHLNHFFISPGKAGTSQAYDYFCFILIHQVFTIIVSKLTIICATIGKLSGKVVKFAFIKYVRKITLFFC